jgi:hypothetical protein
MKPKHTPLERLKHHVTGAIERGESTAIEAVVSKPTPGPWSIEDAFDIIAADGYNLVSVADASIDEGGRPSEDKANARLIAAAPEMLEALEFVETMLILKDAKAPDTLKVVRAAIAKAKGE